MNEEKGTLLAARVRELNHTINARRCGAGRLSRALAAALAVLRERYHALPEGTLCEWEQWLSDNFYALESHAKQALTDLRGQRRNRRQPLTLFALLEKVFGDGETPLTEESVETVLREAGTAAEISERQFDFVCCALNVALLLTAARACGEQQSDEERARLISYAVTGLSDIYDMDFGAMVCRQSAVERILLRDPAGVYPRMAEQSRRDYRAITARIAKRTGARESDVARDVLECAENAADTRARHVGYYLLRHDPRAIFARRRGISALLCAYLLPLPLCAAVWLLAGHGGAALLLYLPFVEMTRLLASGLALRGVRTAHLPRLELRDDAPKTVIVISMLLPDSARAEVLRTRLEQLYFSNNAKNLSYCVLADFGEDRRPENPRDELNLNAARRVIERLNIRYGERFMLFVRRRSYCPTQGNYVGWERKRGAIIEFIRFLKGGKTSVLCFVGSSAALSAFRYLIALDGDTNLAFESANVLVSAAAHPLNRPVIGKHNCVVAGYGVLVPRMETELSAAKQTDFTRVMAGAGGVSTYERECGDFYQDLFGEAIFAGKGLVDIDTFHEVVGRRFPENAVLSHDILEGAYLRAGLLSDVEMTDSMPSNALSWFARLHRWLRGDWQNLRFLGASYTICGVRRKNPMSLLSRYKLFDNLRRSFVPVAAFLCVLCSCFTDETTALLLCASAFLSVTLAPLLAGLRALTVGGRFAISSRFFTRTLPRVFELFGQALLAAIMTAQQAVVAADAMIRTLWRLFVSKKNLLQWTTAAQGECKAAFFDVLCRAWIGESAGLLLLVFAPRGHVITKLFGALFLLYAPVAAATSRAAPAPTQNLPDRAQREQLLSWCARMFAFYEDYATAENHWLPPDNVQFSPREAVARRTSPTNIGMLLLSLLAARDFHFIDSAGLSTRLSRIFDTIESLKTYHGNLYNWYATDDLRVLPDDFVSAVDSGNYLCSLVTLAEGLREYTGQEPALHEIIMRIEHIIAATDFSIFYNKTRKLLTIGIDKEGKPSLSHYDFLMSEARAAGYFAVATRQAGYKHWRALGRAMSRSGAYTGPVSWTGTMFEYFMPHLFLPVYDGSLLDEALHYALYCQKKRAQRAGVPWGISESGYFAFDSALQYQYKAHGVQKLGVKQGLDRECVVAPYATFLTLPFDLDGGMKNLARLESLGMGGRYGFYEAIDFTRGRRSGEGEIVRSYMAHHVGMSMIACANALSDNVMQKRFMRDCSMRAAHEFLQEKIAKDTVVYDRAKPESAMKKAAAVLPAPEEEPVSPLAPRAALLEGGGMTHLFADSGVGRLRFAGEDITRPAPDSLARGQGVFALAKLCGETICATTAPFYQAEVQRSCVFSADSIAFHAQRGAVRLTQTFQAERALPVSRCTLCVRNDSAAKALAEVLFYFEPVLSEEGEYEAHPAFSKLFLSGGRDPATDTVRFSRRRRDGSDGLHLAVGFERPCDFACGLRREEITPYPEGLSALLRFDTLCFAPDSAATPDGCCALRVTLTVPARGERSLTLLISAAKTAEESINSLLTARERACKPAVSPLLRDTMAGQFGARLLPALFFGVPQDCADAVSQATRGQDALWSLGISGDRPIVLFDYAALPDDACLDAYVQLWKLLCLLRLDFDLCVLREEPPAARLPKGVFVFDPRTAEQALLLTLRAAACYVAGTNEPPPPPYTPLPVCRAMPVPLPQADDRFDVAGGLYSGGRFYVERVTPLPFSHILSNDTCGALLQDASLGNTWWQNAREGKLTPWRNDIARGDDGEQLLLRADGLCYDLCDGARASFSPEDARYESICGTIAAEVRVWLSDTAGVKYLEVTLENQGEAEVEIICAYKIEPVLGVSRRTARYTQFSQQEGCLVLHNRYNMALPFCAALRVPGEHPSYTAARAAFLAGDWAAGTLLPNSDPIAATLVRKKLPPRRRERIRFILAAAATAAEAVAAANAPAPTAKRDMQKITIDTPSEPLNRFFNTFLAHQVLAGRLQGRCAFYQCSGAYGFRDQLQDAGGYLSLDSSVARAQILRCCAVQFPEGDVLHWWHALPTGTRGVRTTFSDDLLWLPLTVCDYVETTGDMALLSLSAPYCAGDALAAGEHERYLEVRSATEAEDVYGHCLRAIAHAYQLGDKGIPKIGCGDWNDGFSQVGVKGQGQSVWLGMFLAMVLDRFSELCVRRGEHDRAQEFRQRAALLRQSIDENCWDGQWYLRAFYDSGTPMGGKDAAECRIDLLSQSFATLAEMPDHTRTACALDSALERLVDDEYHLIKLFTPPFHNAAERPGYVMAYPRGVRENGGQYTHAAIWFAMALLAAGKVDEGWRMLDYLNPTARCTDAKLAAAFKTEPYYMPADIYASSDAYAHGGWSIYTGAAAWYHRAVLEALLGIHIRGSRLTLSPAIPAAWGGFSVTLHRTGCTISITVTRGKTHSLLVDTLPAADIPLDGENHTAVLTLAGGTEVTGVTGGAGEAGK